MEENKMTNEYKIAEHNVITDEYILRDMTDDEIVQRLKDEAENDQKAEEYAQAAAKKATAEAKLAALGLTADDLRALGL